MARLASPLLATLLVAWPALAEPTWYASVRTVHELRAQDDGEALGLAIRSTYTLGDETRVALASPVCTPLEVVAPTGASLTRDPAGCVTDVLVPAGQHELVLAGSQRVRRDEPTRIGVPLRSDPSLELVVVSGADGAQLEPSDALGMVRHVGYLASASVTEDESTAFGAWRVHQPLSSQYLLVRAGRGSPPLDGRLTTRGTRARPFLVALVGVTLAGLAILAWMRRRLAQVARGEEADAIIARHDLERP